MTRVFRETHERLLPPEGRDVMWLRPCDGSYTLMVYKPEDGKWIGLNRTAWGDLLDMPDSFKSETALDSRVTEVAKAAVSSSLMATDVAYSYGGDVEAVKGLPGELDRGGAMMPSVASILSLLIGKAWFKPLAVTVSGKTPDIAIGEEAPAREVAFTVSNLIPGEGASVTASVSDPDDMAMSVEGSEAGGVAIVARFTPTLRKDYSVTVTATCADSDGVAGAQTASARSAAKAWWPVWAWTTGTTGGAGGIEGRGARQLLKGPFTMKYASGTYYYHLLVPSELKTATQANTGDWNGNFKLVSTGGLTICGREYRYYRSPRPVTSTASTSVDITITLTSII